MPTLFRWFATGVKPHEVRRFLLVGPRLSYVRAHVIVCLDANFSQKRRKCAAADPALEYLDGRFVPEPIVDAMEADVEERRKGKPKTRTRGTSARVPDHILDECEESFLAAQETVAKASKNYYAETGLMALLCRHDRVLWVVNLTSPGERQHYALTLLRQLGKELPEDWHIGVLYDIACQLSRSIEKASVLRSVPFLTNATSSGTSCPKYLIDWFLEYLCSTRTAISGRAKSFFIPESETASD